MNERNLIPDLDNHCKELSIDFEKAKNGLEKLVGGEAILDYCITRGQSPIIPQTLLEVFVLTEKCLYNYEIQKEGTLEHFIFLSQLAQISEEWVVENHFKVHFYTGGSSLVLIERTGRLDDIRKFISAIRSATQKCLGISIT